MGGEIGKGGAGGGFYEGGVVLADLRGEEGTVLAMGSGRKKGALGEHQ